MRYNFSLLPQQTYWRYCRLGVQLMCWLLSIFNMFFSSVYVPKKAHTIPPKLIVFPIIKAEMLQFIYQLAPLDIRLLSVDIYPQEMMIKGLSYQANYFLNALQNLSRFSGIQQNELLDWHQRKDGAWFFYLRIMFKR